MARGVGSGLLVFGALAALSSGAQAENGLFCQGTLSYPDGYNVCVGSQASADYLKTVASLGLGPDRMEGSLASTGEVATSSFGAASAEVSAKVGVLSGKTHAEVLTTMPTDEQDSKWTSSGLASAAFRDTVLIQAQPGVALGTPVAVHLRTKVQGAFSAVSAKGVPGGEADFTGQVYLVYRAGGQTALQVPLSGVFWSYDGQTGGTSDTLLPNVKTGDSLDIHWALRIESFVTQLTTLPKTDSEVVAQLFIDVDPATAVAIGQTAYDYRSNTGDAGASAADAGASGADAGAGGEAGIGAEGGTRDPGGAIAADAGASAAGADNAPASGEGGSAQAEASGAGGTNAQQPDAGRSDDSGGCSISLTNAGSRHARLPFAFALGGALLALIRRRRSARAVVR
ncbi:MAG TPA: hypothetical protein VGJ91_24555 [Polyangiaceae bacterium]|jgi:hypothetical protein